MVSAIVSTVPLGLGIAFNPVAIVASILILRRASARLNGTLFVIGWISGLALLVVLSALLVQDQLGARRGAAAELPAVLWIGLGILLLAAAARTARNRPLPGEEPELPRWTRIIDQGGGARMLGLGAILATVSIRNLLLLAAAAGIIGQAQLPFVERSLAIAAFVAVSTLGVLIPLLVRAFGGEGAEARLAAGGDWLIRNAAAITAVVMAALGVGLLVRGLAGVN